MAMEGEQAGRNRRNAAGSKVPVRRRGASALRGGEARRLQCPPCLK